MRGTAGLCGTNRNPVVHRVDTEPTGDLPCNHSDHRDTRSQRKAIGVTFVAVADESRLPRSGAREMRNTKAISASTCPTLAFAEHAFRLWPTRSVAASSDANGRTSTPQLAPVRDTSARRHDDATSPPEATRGHRLAHVASAKVADQKTSGQRRNGSFPVKTGRRSPREQSHRVGEFVLTVRTPQKEVFMTPSNKPTDRSLDRAEFWRTIVVPTAKGLEGFLWRVAWFVVIVKILLFS